MLWLIFLIWLVASWWPAKNILAKIFGLDKKIIGVLAVFLPIFVLGLVANIFTAWFKLNDLTIYLALILSYGGLFVADRFLLKETVKLTEIELKDDDKNIAFVFYPWLYVVFGLITVLGFYNIFHFVSGRYLKSPWQTLNGWQILIIVALAALVVYSFYCRKISTVAVLLMLMSLSLLVHSYLLVYQNGFGADRFRHLGSEERILQGLEYQPTLLTSNFWFKDLGPFKYPQALTDSAKLSYGTMWSLEVIAAKISGLSVFQINRFLLPLLWSIFLTLIIFATALLLSADKKTALWSALFAQAFYLFQYYGAQGLPASYGLLWLAFYFLGLIGYLKNPSRPKAWLLLAGLVLMYFNYSLAFFLVGIGLVLAVSLVYKKYLVYILTPFSILFLIGLDYLSSPTLALAWSKILAAWTFGNFLTFQSLNRFMLVIGEWHRLDFLLMLVLGLAILIGLRKIWRQQDPAWLLVALMAKIILVAYFISYWFLDGEHLLTRRLVLFAILFLVFILADLAKSAIVSRKSWLAVSVAAIFITSLSYYSGPVLDISISDREMEKAKAIWYDIKKQKNYCVKDDLNVILALEYFSAKEFQETINNENCQIKD